MFLKLTNAAKEHKDKEIIIHSRYIVSVFPFTPEGSEEETTIVYSALKDSWSVKETPEQIYAMLAEIEQQ
jgi:hypothetical protein